MIRVVIWIFRGGWKLEDAMALFYYCFAEKQPRKRRPVATGCVTPRSGNASRQICNLTRQINEVSLRSALISGSLAMQALASCSRISERPFEAFQRG